MIRILAVIIGLPFLSISFSWAADLDIKIKDQDGSPVEGVVVEVVAEQHAPSLVPHKTIIDQINKEFAPTETVITVGTKINFPNRDDISHHVYSFSRAKQFELPLYKGIPANPVIFDQPGIVILGCNIHDWMKAYVYIAESDKYIRTDTEGFGTFKDLLGGSYKIKLWHSKLKRKKTPILKTIELNDDQVNIIDATLNLKNDLKIRRSPTRRDREY